MSKLQEHIAGMDERFDQTFPPGFIAGGGIDGREKLKSHLHQEVQKVLEILRAEIEGMKQSHQHPMGAMGDCCLRVAARNQALDEILSLTNSITNDK